MEKLKLKIPRLLTVLWLVVVVGMGYLIFDYAFTAGDQTIIKTWPVNSKLALSNRHPSLVVFLHPKCVCSEATMTEVLKLRQKMARSVDIHFVFKSYGNSEEVRESGLWKDAQKISRYLHIDEKGTEANQVGALTSGITYLVSPKGEVVFQGGVTPSRGHQGETQGQEVILAWLEGDQNKSFIDKVFGCGL